jgi:AraC-like DNA-binding protein
MIPETFVQLLYEYLDTRGVNAEDVLRHPWPVPQANGLGGVPIERWIALLTSAATHLNDPHFGLKLGQSITPRHIGVLAYVIQASENLAAVIERLEHYQRLIYDVTPMVQRYSTDYVDLVWDKEHGMPGSLVDETAISALIHFYRSLTRTSLNPLLVQFLNPEPADVKPYLDYFGCPVLFNQDETIVRVALKELITPLKTADPNMMALMEQQADLLLQQLPCEDVLIEQVRQTIARLLHDGEPDIKKVAEILNTSARTLQRRLSTSDSSFRKELEIVRRQMAENYLRESRLSIADIAMLLGYSEHSAFSRSYKIWTGMTPHERREQN